ncbi:MAG: hypothetical protein OSB03_05230 [Vicinamibacterales bacterium]|nr:hypothetical protein [Vicinamibacterales bacterium]
MSERTIRRPGRADGVLGYHLNPLTCGVAKFNLLLARHLEVPMLSVFDDQAASMAHPVLSLKQSEFSDADSATLAQLLDTASWRHGFSLFLHAWTDTDVERTLLSRAATVYCGNAELVAKLRVHRPDVQDSWCPSTLLEPQRFRAGGLSVFAFGMAHKVRSELHRTVHALLERTGQPYSVYLSTALHEGTAFDERFTVVFDELQEIYGDHIFFLGYMSDTAVYNYLIDTTFFAAFFDKGVRANNTTVNAAMECGSVVLTNFDDYSPSVFDHMHNVIDIHRCETLPTDPETLQSIGDHARTTASGALGWDALVSQMRG